jgi:hypothetical protein
MAWAVPRRIMIGLCYGLFENDNELSGDSNFEESLQYTRLYYHLKMDSTQRVYSGT